MAGVILAGGQSRRFGSNKALAQLNGRPLIEISAEVMAAIFPERLLITNDPAAYEFLGWPMAGDIFTDAGPLAGIHAALSQVAAEEIMVVACDMPFIKGNLIRLICQPANKGIVIPRLDQGLLEPLMARYHKKILPPLTAALDAGERRLHTFIKGQNPTYIEARELRTVDPSLASFRNINHRHDLRAHHADQP